MATDILGTGAFDPTFLIVIVGPYRHCRVRRARRGDTAGTLVVPGAGGETAFGAGYRDDRVLAGFTVRF